MPFSDTDSVPTNDSIARMALSFAELHARLAYIEGRGPPAVGPTLALALSPKSPKRQRIAVTPARAAPLATPRPGTDDASAPVASAPRPKAKLFLLLPVLYEYCVPAPRKREASTDE